MKNNYGVYAIYDGKIAERRRKGQTLQEIGDATGVCRERIRQILKDKYPDVKPQTFSEQEAAKILRCLPSTLTYLRKQGKIKPFQYSFGKRLRYKPRDIEELKPLLIKSCRICGNHLEPPKIHYCDKHSNAEIQRYLYLNNPKYYLSCKLANKIYFEKIKNNPILYKKLRKRKLEYYREYYHQKIKKNPILYEQMLNRQRKHQAKKRQKYFANTFYIIKSDNAPLPKGTIFRAIGLKNWHFILAGGERISTNFISKLM